MRGEPEDEEGKSEKDRHEFHILENYHNLGPVQLLKQRTVAICFKNEKPCL